MLRGTNEFSHEIGPIRPPSEGQDSSLLVRATRNCPWNRCEFCATYKGKRFELRSLDEIERDIDVIVALSEEIRSTSRHLGLGGRITSDVVVSMVRGNPHVYGDSTDPERLQARINSLMNVASWLNTGGKTAFLQDGDSPIMKTPQLLEVVKYLKEKLPTIERITSYARSKTISRKTVEELRQLHEAGLSRLHIGLESGCDAVLAQMQKGATGAEHVKAGRNVVESGISLSEYVMPGLGGRRWSEQHALDTARVLNEIGPDFIRLRSLVLRQRTGIRDIALAGSFDPLSEDEMVAEIGLLISTLNCRSYLASDHMSNLLGEIEGRLPEDKARLLDIVASYQSMTTPERLAFSLHRRLRARQAVYGELREDVAERVQAALDALQKERPDAEAFVYEALEALKQGFI
ncbi:MAG: radical SAM protein [Chloroflexi bacterium]|nr:radical SAM protein [Chloroflexota bacterium]